MSYVHFDITPIKDAFWNCSAIHYRRVEANKPTAANALGNKWSYSQIGTIAQMSLDEDMNFDSPTSGFGQMKTMYSSQMAVASVDPSVDVIPFDVLKITTPTGQTRYWTVRGIADARFTLPAGDYLVTQAEDIEIV